MFFVRADGNAQMGAGHLMRCLTVAEEIKKKQAVTVLCGDTASASLAESLGFRAFVLGEIPFSPEEAQKICRLIQKLRDGKQAMAEDMLLADSYLLADGYVAALSGAVKVICFDDMAKQAYPHAWKIVNYNIFAHREQYEKLYEGISGGENGLPDFLLGASYIPLRPQFTGLHYRVRDRAGEMLITTGGGDEKNIAGEILRRLLSVSGLEEAVFHVVNGAFSPNYAELTELEQCDRRVKIHKNVENMAALMLRCDLAVTAGGTTVYELCAAGVPFVCFSYAENQKRLAAYMAELGMGAGDYTQAPETVLNNIAVSAGRLWADREARMRLSQKERELVDGQGSKRLAKAFLGE